MIIPNASTDVTTYFVMRDSTNHAPKADVTVTDIDLYYQEQGAAQAAKADVTALAAADSAHADNKGYHCGNSVYRIDWPDAAFDGGVGKRVILIVVCTGCDTVYREVLLSPQVDVQSISGDATAADNCELMFDGTGYAGGTTKLGVDVVSVSGDTTAADNAEAFFDGTGYAGTNNVIPTVTSVTNRVTADTTHIAGSAVSTSTAQIGVNVIQAAGTAWGSGAITAGSIASNAIAAAKIATGAITNAKFAAGAINAAAIAADAIGASELAADAVTEIVTGVWNAATSSYGGAGTYGQAVEDALADTSELQAEFVDGGRLDLLIDAIKAKTDNLPTDPADQSAVEAAITAAHTTTNGKIDAVDDYVDTEIAAIKAVTDKLDTAVELDGAVYRLTANALELAPVDGAAPTAAAIRAEIDANSTQLAAIKTKTDGLNFTGTDVKATLDGETVTVGTNNDKTGYALTAAYDAAKTAAPESGGNIAAIKAKTDNLPADPADQSAVEAAITAAHSTTNGKIDAVDDYVDTEVAAVLAAVDTEVAAIKAKTDNLPDSPAAVGSPMTLTSDYDAAKTASSQTSVNTVDGIVDDIIVDTGTTIPAVLTTIEGKIDAIAPGAGAIEWTYTVATSGGVPISGVSVWCTSDVAGTVVLQSGTTNASGVVTFWLAAGTVYVWCYKEGYNFTNPDVETVS